jgi:ParB/RepB/Spo0J family partition protein
LRDHQLQDIGILEDGTVLYGHRRVKAALLVGLETLTARIYEEAPTESEINLIQLAENIHRVDLPVYDKYMSCGDLLRLNPGWQLKDLAERLHLDATSVTRIMSVGKCIPPVVEALREGRINAAQQYAISKALDEAAQAEALMLALNGHSREKLDSVIRKARTVRETPEESVGRCRLPLKSGTCITVAGSGLTLEAVSEALAQVLDSVKKAIKEGLDIKTAARVFADRAKAGVP